MAKKPRVDTELDLLMELVSHPGWRIFRKEAKRIIDGHVSFVKSPAENEFDFITKEVRLGKIVAIEELLQEVENMADDYAKHNA